MSRYFTEDHEWIDVDGEVGTVGISDYAQGQLGDITSLLPETERPSASIAVRNVQYRLAACPDLLVR